MNTLSANPPTHHDVVIIGAGNAGLSLAARLRRDGFRDIAIVDPAGTHRYRPLLSYVGGGQAKMSDLERPQAKLIPRGVRWYQRRVTSVNPQTKTVYTEGGAVLSATDLVVCPGVEQDWGAAPGSEAAVHSDHGASNYVDERAGHTWELIRGLRSGKAVFVVADGPVPCAGAALKPLFLAADYWRRTGVLSDIEVTAVVGWDSIFGIDRVDAELQHAADRFGITVQARTAVCRIDAAARELELVHDDETTHITYDLLHLVPRHRAPSWIRESDLAVPESAAGLESRSMIDVSPTTLAHRRHPDVWGLGDAANVQASRSGGALRKQVAVVADNIARRRAGSPLVDYNGYSTAPITVSRNQVVLAEFDRHGTLTPSVPFIDLVKARRFTWAYDRYLQPLLYWFSILKGRVSR